MKTGIAFFLIGVTLALVGPTVAEAIGFSGEALAHIAQANAMPLWTGTFFGMFGAMSQVVVPLVDRVFDDTPERHITTVSESQIAASSPNILQDIQPAMHHEAGFSERVIAERGKGQAEKMR